MQEVMGCWGDSQQKVNHPFILSTMGMELLHYGRSCDSGEQGRHGSLFRTQQWKYKHTSAVGKPFTKWSLSWLPSLSSCVIPKSLLCIYSAALGFSCSMQDLRWVMWDLSFRPMDSLIVACQLSSCDAWAWLTVGMWDVSSLTRNRTHIPCTARHILKC